MQFYRLYVRVIVFANVNVEKMRCTSSFIGARVELVSSSVLREEPWAGDRPISIDMLQQYFMASITEASLRGIGKFIDDRSASFQVPVSVMRNSSVLSAIARPRLFFWTHMLLFEDV